MAIELFDRLSACSFDNKGGEKMAISALPVDGLINRLIQQHQRPVVKTTNSSAKSSPQADQVNISNQAKVQAGGGEIPQEPSKLENQLLQMYSAHSVGR